MTDKQRRKARKRFRRKYWARGRSLRDALIRIEELEKELTEIGQAQRIAAKAIMSFNRNYNG